MSESILFPTSLKKQITSLEVALASRGYASVYSPTYVIGGSIVIAIGVAGLIWGLVVGPYQHDYIGEWAFVSVIVLPCMLFGWITAVYSRMRVSPEGIQVINPINEALIPYASLVRATGYGVSLRLYGDRWSMGVYAVQRANVTAAGKSSAERAAVLLTDHAAVRRLVVPGASAVPSPAPRKNWTVRWPELVVWAALSALSFVYEYVLHAPISMHH